MGDLSEENERPGAPRKSRLSTATTPATCCVCGAVADQERYVCRSAGGFRFVRCCSWQHAQVHQRRQEWQASRPRRMGYNEREGMDV